MDIDAKLRTVDIDAKITYRLVCAHHIRLLLQTYQLLHIFHHPMPHKSLLNPEDSAGLPHVPSSCIDMASLEDSLLLVLTPNETQHHLSLYIVMHGCISQATTYIKYAYTFAPENMSRGTVATDGNTFYCNGDYSTSVHKYDSDSLKKKMDSSI